MHGAFRTRLLEQSWRFLEKDERLAEQNLI